MSAIELIDHEFIRKIRGGGEKVQFESMIAKMIDC